MMRVTAWGLALCSALACRAQHDQSLALPSLDIDHKLAVMPRDNGDLVGLNPRTGEVLWTYVPVGRQRATRSPPPFDPEPTYPLLCPIQKTPDRHIILRYRHEFVSLHADGTLWWERGVPSRWSNADEHCPTVAPDSGVAYFGARGKNLRKLTQDGEDAFVYRLVDVGRPTTAPRALDPSGDILVRTTHFLLSINPAGELNWRTPLGELTEDPVVDDEGAGEVR